MSHWDNLASHIGGFAGKRVLDLGSGKGSFLIEAARHGVSAVGVETSSEYIRKTREAAERAGVIVQVEQGKGEAIPLPDSSFDFANVNEVIEHVDDPAQMLAELHRVLIPGAKAYLSVPNRFGMKDQHFHLYFVNWLPRSWSDAFISLFGRHKPYDGGSIGRQRLADMHYYTYQKALRAIRAAGFKAEDIRELRIRARVSRAFQSAALLIYRFFRFAVFDSFHFLLTK